MQHEKPRAIVSGLLNGSLDMNNRLRYLVLPLICSSVLTGCATGAGANLNETASLENLESRVEVLEEKLNQALKSIATAKIDASTALQLMTLENENQKASEADQ